MDFKVESEKKKVTTRSSSVKKDNTLKREHKTLKKDKKEIVSNNKENKVIHKGTRVTNKDTKENRENKIISRESKPVNKTTNKENKVGRTYRKTDALVKKEDKTVKKEKTVRTPRTPREIKSDYNSIKIIPLGGLHEVGKNITAIEYKNDIFVIDCGLKFPDDDMYGIDLVIPDISFLIKNKDRVKGIFLTHGHEDHLGALPYILKQINVPVFGTKLTLGILSVKLKEHYIDYVELNVIKPKDIVKIGNVTMEFIKMNHSIADAVSIAIHTPIGILFHTGDFKIDFTPIDGEIADLGRIAELGKKGIICMLGESTNVEKPGYTISERVIGKTFESIFGRAKSRIIVATFASNVHRIQQIINAAAMYGKKVAISGRSMENITGVAKELGYIQFDDNVLISIDEINRWDPSKIVIITTGTQGEPMSALARMASGDHKKVSIVAGDTVILSATPIPGNEKLVSKVINKLFNSGAEVIYESLAKVHVSGHACQEELKLMLALAKPKYFMPIHGEFRHLKQHVDLAESLGIDRKNTIIAECGDVIEVKKNGINKIGTVPSGQIFVDGLGVGDVGNIVLKDRKHLSQDGVLTVVVTIDSQTGSIIAGPDIISRGFVYVRESERLIENIRELVKEVLKVCEEDGVTEWSTLKVNIKDKLRNFLYEKTKRRPMILPIIMEI